MFDWIWAGDMNLSVLVWIAALVVVLPVQLLLCFKAKSRTVRLFPVTLLGALAVIFLLLALAATGWEGAGYLFFAIYAALMMLMCGAGWGIWAIVYSIKKRKSRKT